MNLSGSVFKIGANHRINENGGVEDINEPYPTTMEEDERFEFNWRLMTEEEKEQYKKIIQNIEFQ